jgi:signal transduction histidine kinase
MSQSFVSGGHIGDFEPSAGGLLSCDVGPEAAGTDRASFFKPQRAEVDHEELLDMIKILCHDIRSPLVSMTAGLKLLLAGRFGEMDERVSEELGKIFSMVAGLLGVLEDSVGKAFSVEEAFDLAHNSLELRRDIVQPVLTEISKKIGDRSITLKDNEIGSGNFRVYGNPFWLKAVFRNLLKNAIQYGGYGCRIELGCEYRKKWIRCNVFNSGVPIPRQYRRELFKKFSHVSLKGSKNQRGLGLGLYMVKEIIQRHGGKIWYEAKEDGSNFVFTLPAV